MNYLHELSSLPKGERIRKGIEYTPLEVESQPRLWTENFEMLKEREEEIRSFVEERILQKKSPRVVLSGAGSSAFIGLAAQNLLRYRWRLDVDARATTDIITHWDSVFLRNADNVMISFSRSGNSPESVGAFVLANRFCDKISHLIITCNKDGKLAKIGNGRDDVLLLLLSEETNDKGLAMTSSFTTMLMATQFLAYVNDLKRYERIIGNLSNATRNLFEDYSGLVKEISENDFERAVFLGSGCLYGCAVESSLKLQEMTDGRIICKADTFMGVRHGPEVVINDKTIVIFFSSSDPFVRRYELDLMREIETKRIGMKKIVICDRCDDETESYVDYVIEFDRDNRLEIPDLCRPMMDVTIGQMMGLFKSLSLNLKPDNPSEKEIITRVVRNVRIYDNEASKKKGKFVALVN